MKQCNVCDQYFEDEEITEGKHGFVICKSCLEFKDAEFMPEHIIDDYDLADEAEGQK